MRKAPPMPKNTPPRPTSHSKRPNVAGSYYLIAGKGKYKAAIQDVQGKLRTKVFTNEVQAQDWLLEQKRNRELGNATYALHPKDSVTTLLTKFLASHLETSNMGRTRATKVPSND